MGFDLIGINPKNKKGDCFRNNGWWWRPLWDFCCILVLQIDKGKGWSNDGYEIKGRQHKALVERIKYALEHKDEFEALIKTRQGMFAMQNQLRAIKENGLTNSEKEELVFSEEFNESKYPFDWGNVMEFYNFISNNEGFQIF